MNPKPLNFVISGTTFWNPGDDFVREGVIRVLRARFANRPLNFLFYNFNPEFFPQSKFKGVGNFLTQGDLDQLGPAVDGVIVAGLSAGAEVKDLYEWILRSRLDDRVFLIGAGYENDYAASYCQREPFSTIFRRAKVVIGRTRAVPDAFRSLGIQYVHLNCPALLSVEQVKPVPAGKRIERIGFSLQLPHSMGITNQACGEAAMLLGVRALKSLAGRFEVEVVAHHKSEYAFFIEALRSTAIPVRFSSFVSDMHDIYRRFDLVITTRLHASLYANGHGIPGIILNDTPRHSSTIEGFPHSTLAQNAAQFEAQFERALRLDLCAVAEQADRFKTDLLARYVAALQEPFAGLSDAGNSSSCEAAGPEGAGDWLASIELAVAHRENAKPARGWKRWKRRLMG